MPPPPQAARRFAETASSAARRNVIGSAGDGLCGDEPARGRRDRVRVDPAAASSSSGLPEPGISRDRKVLERELFAGERREHGLAEPAFRPVVLDDDDAPAVASAGVAQRRPRRPA